MFHISGIIQHVTFCVWPLSLSILLSLFLQVRADILTTVSSQQRLNQQRNRLAWDSLQKPLLKKNLINLLQKRNVKIIYMMKRFQNFSGMGSIT